jgi:hypothetical protein
MVYLFIFLVAREIQCSWYLGPGERGPVSHFGRQFHISNNIAYLYLQQYITLSPSHVDTSQWRHIEIDNDSKINGHNLILPADFDKDGDFDLCAAFGDQVVWYEQVSPLDFQRRFIGNFPTEKWTTVWPWDMDGDKDFDIVVSSGRGGLVWYENNQLTFTRRDIDGGNWLYARPCDVDNDKDADIIVNKATYVNASNYTGYTWEGPLYLFKNNGSMQFDKILITNDVDHRINLADFNNDGFIDIQRGGRSLTNRLPCKVRIYLNNKNGTFEKSYESVDVRGIDGSWPSDFDGDGWVDVMINLHATSEFYWYRNEGEGRDFTSHFIEGVDNIYGDGGMVCDLNLDARNDIIGAYTRIGWLEQLPNGTFRDRPLGRVDTCHWVYGLPMAQGPCESMSNITADILYSENGGFGLYHNQMIVRYLDKGFLESSILEASDTCGCVKWVRLGWHDCIPTGFRVQYRVRTDSSSANLMMKPWSAPFVSPGNGSHYDTLIGFEGKYAQYRIEIEKTNPSALYTPIIDTVWIEYICERAPGIEEVSEKINIDLVVRGDKVFYTIPKPLDISISIYDITGRVVKEVWKGKRASGTYSFDLPTKSGTYIVQLQYNGTLSKKCVVVK